MPWISLRGSREPSVSPDGNRLARCGTSGAERLSRQKLPAAAVLHPDLHHADLGRARLSARFDFGGEDVAGDGVVADHGDAGVAERDRLEDRLLVGNGGDELGLGLDLAAGMAVAQLVGGERFEPGLVGGHHRLGKILDGLADGGFVRRLGMSRDRRGRQHKRAGRGEMTTGDTHWAHSLVSIVMIMAAEDQRFRPSPSLLRGNAPPHQGRAAMHGDRRQPMLESSPVEVRMRLLGLLIVAIVAIAGHAYAADPASDDAVVVLRGSSAPPEPWYEPPPQTEVQVVYVPVYSLPLAYGTFLPRHHHRPPASRHR